MDIVKDYNVSFIDPSNFSKFVEGFSEPISNDWFYPPYSGNLNYLINKRFYCPLFYLKIDNAYLLGLLSAYIDDNGIYPHINLRLFNNQGIELGCDKNIYLFLQKSVEGEMHQITGEIINNKLICRSIIRGYYDDINYKDPFEKCSEVTYEIKNTGFNYISEVILYEKKL